MRVALTGSSSTGKTTLAKKLLEVPEFRVHVDKFLTTNARGLLDEMGHHSMDRMRPDDRRSFQRAYFRKKQEMEEGQDRFVTDRSFVDVAAYWLRRDAPDRSPEEQAELVRPCSVAAQRYVLHVYCPFGVLQFEPDGYRSEDLKHHQEIDAQTTTFLKDWGLRFVTLDTPSLDERVERVLQELRLITAGR
jgi:nicotinamide riboside kinase